MLGRSGVWLVPSPGRARAPVLSQDEEVCEHGFTGARDAERLSPEKAPGNQPLLPNMHQSPRELVIHTRREEGGT
jgi:hypothetical protein